MPGGRRARDQVVHRQATKLAVLDLDDDFAITEMRIRQRVGEPGMNATR
jgi:hypothetical protein